MSSATFLDVVLREQGHTVGLRSEAGWHAPIPVSSTSRSKVSRTVPLEDAVDLHHRYGVAKVAA